MFEQEINKRRTFAIISHPDAGKTTLTEKFLLYGGAINLAGTVKGRKAQKTATSDWMEIEKQRGISVTSSAMQFEYHGKCINILDTPGHQDFSEDTYRTLMAADQAVMVIDAAKGVEPQTIKLFKVCTIRKIPIFTFINKLDREAKDPFVLMDQIEEILGIKCCVMNFPISSGKTFKGIYDRKTKKIITYIPKDSGAREIETKVYSLDESKDIIGSDMHEKLLSDIELLDGASEAYDKEKVDNGELTPIFFGSALANFGVEIFLNNFIDMTNPPKERLDNTGKVVSPYDEKFSGFVFKIQANMNKAHRDRIAFLFVFSGKFTANCEVNLFKADRRVKLSQTGSLFASERKIIEEAYAGDIIGVFDPGIYSIGETFCEPPNKFCFEGIPTFAPEHFARVRQIDTMKRKQFVKGISQIALEGAIQVFNEGQGMEEIIVGVVGELQFDVLIFRLKSEYNVEVKIERLPYEYIRWIDNYTNVEVDRLTLTTDTKKIYDLKGRPLLLFQHEWSPKMVEDRNEGLLLKEFSVDK